MTEQDKDTFLGNLNEQGYAILRNVVGPSLLNQLRTELDRAIDIEAAYHNNDNHPDRGMVQICPLYGKSFLKLLDIDALIDPINTAMGNGSILYVYTSSFLPPSGGTNRSTRIHVDRAQYDTGRLEMLGCLVLLDDFTAHNGATRYLPGSHTLLEKPTQEDFDNNALTLEEKAGSVFFFNARLWHTSGTNFSDKSRGALALGIVPPYYKQKFDLPRAMKEAGIETLGLPLRVLQKLGFHSIPPRSLAEYYDPKLRTYTQASEWNT